MQPVGLDDPCGPHSVQDIFSVSVPRGVLSCVLTAPAVLSQLAL